jgi:heme/copper-type cytochrome/quinol oxidase subunit 2
MYRSKLDKDQRMFNIMFRTVVTIIAIFWIAIIAFMIFVGTTSIKAADQVEQRGLKDAVEEIWCGPNNKCL